MSLSLQFFSLLLSFIYGIVMAFVYSVINRCVYRWQKSLFRYVIEGGMMAAFSYLYVMINVYFNDGQISMYMLLFLGLGLICYERYYAHYCLSYLEYGINLLNDVFSPINFIFNKICAIVKTKKRVVRQWLKRNKKGN